MMINPTFWRAAALAALALPFVSAPSNAENLNEALSKALSTNPVLQGARARQRATEEEPAIQRARGLPSIAATVNHREFIRQSANDFAPPARRLTASAELLVPVYSGGAVENSVLAASERVGAGLADLRGRENSLLVEVVSAYMDVILSEALVELGRSNVAVLQANLEATGERFRIGDLTLTDVAQSRSRLAVALAGLRQAEADLVTARGTYQQLVGSAPGELEPPPPLYRLPRSAGEALEAALSDNPDLAAARKRAEAAGYDTRAAGAGRLPLVSLAGNADYNDFFGTLQSQLRAPVQREITGSAGVEVAIPVYQGGLPAAQQREAGAQESAALEEVIAEERLLVDQTRSTFARWQAAEAVTTSSGAAVAAAELSLEGVRAGNLAGERTVLDVLNAEQELLDARTQLVSARRDAYVEGFMLLALMGRTGAQDLGLDRPDRRAAP